MVAKSVKFEKKRLAFRHPGVVSSNACPERCHREISLHNCMPKLNCQLNMHPSHLRIAILGQDIQHSHKVFMDIVTIRLILLTASTKDRWLPFTYTSLK